MTDFDLPPEAVEAAANAMHDQHWPSVQELNRGEACSLCSKYAETAIQAFLTAMGAGGEQFVIKQVAASDIEPGDEILVYNRRHRVRSIRPAQYSASVLLDLGDRRQSFAAKQPVWRVFPWLPVNREQPQ